MKPGYLVALLIALLIIGEHLWKKKKVQTKEFVTILVAALVAGAFGGLLVEGALSLFRVFMQA